MKRLFFLLLMIIFTGTCIAQEHCIKCPNCKYCKKEKDAKKPNSIAARGSDESICRVCEKKETEERKARQAEQKRLQEATVKQNQTVREAMHQKTIAETKKNKSTEVVIVNNPSPAKPVDKPEIDKTTTNLRFMSGVSSGYFVDRDARKMLERPENSNNKRIVTRTYGTSRLEGMNIGQFLHPAETGVIQYGNTPPVYYNKYGLNDWDIVDYNWNTLFNDQSIHYIEHFYENWFLIGYLPCDKYEYEYTRRAFTDLKLYNTKTKKYYTIQIDGSFHRLQLESDATHGLYHDGHGKSLFHNPFYITGKYAEGNLKHGCYELYFDKITGGKDGWKAAVPIWVYGNTNANDYYCMAFLMDKSDNFKLLRIDKDEYKKYFDQRPQ